MSMASSKERQRWEQWYEQVSDRMNRQAAAIERLVVMTTVSRAALQEIADREVPHNVQAEANAYQACRGIAKGGLVKMDTLAAAVAEERARLEQGRVPDPRREA